MYAYIQNERLLEKMQLSTGRGLPPDSTKNKLADYIQNTCRQIKGLILVEGHWANFIAKDFEGKNIMINERNVGNDFWGNGAGVVLLSGLKTAVIKYNKLNVIDQPEAIPVNYSILAVEPGKINSYTNLFILNGITQLQM